MKITREIDEEFAEAFKKSELFPLYQSHSDELFIGVRNNYLNDIIDGFYDEREIPK
jgi:hypothetical protein